MHRARQHTAASPFAASLRHKASLLFLLALGSCGYASGSGLHDQNIRTVQIRAVANDTFRQLLEVELSVAVSRELVVSSDLLPGGNDSDAILELRILNDRELTIVSGTRATTPVREGAIESVVQVRLLNRRNGKLVIDRTVRDRAEFRDPLGQNLTTAEENLVADLARKIVLALESGF